MLWSLYNLHVVIHVNKNRINASAMTIMMIRWRGHHSDFQWSADFLVAGNKNERAGINEQKEAENINF